MEEEFKEQMKQQIDKLNEEIKNKVAEYKRIKTVIKRLRAERSNMTKILLGKLGISKKKKDESKEV